MAEKKASAKKAAKKTAKPAAKKEGATRGKFLSKTVKVKAEENPHREGTFAFDQFKMYKDGMEVSKLIEKGARRAYIYHDAWKGYIELV